MTDQSVLGPYGRITLESLPLPDDRWTVRRKAEVAAAIHGGLITAQEACDRYNLSVEEITSWQRSVKLDGVAGLRVTRLQHYRKMESKRG